MRTASGGTRIDRGSPITVTVDGTAYAAFTGDTVASALVAADALAVAPSIYRRRPRGLLAADLTEPNALVQTVDGGEVLPATAVEVTDGLAVRTLSGVGRLALGATGPDGSFVPVNDKKFVHTDVLVVGAGPAGLAAALTASSGGARVLLVDDQPAPGGDLLLQSFPPGSGVPQWIADAGARLAGRPEVTILARSSVFGYYDQNYLLVLERRPTGHRVWHVRARQVVLATGARERPLVFENNDRPGIMLASAVRAYLNGYGALSATRAVVATIDDSAYRVALDLMAAGVDVAAVVDTRPEPPGGLADRVRAAGADVIAGSVICGTSGSVNGRGARLSAVQVRTLDDDGALEGGGREIHADLLAVAGGWSPDVHLFSQSRGELVWDPAIAGFRPGRPTQAVICAGAANGVDDTAGALAGGAAAGAHAAELAGYAGDQDLPVPFPAGAGEDINMAGRATVPPRPVWLIPAATGEPAQWHDHFVDLHRDVSVADIWRSVGSGMRSLEHIKRYTTLGTGYDQGATSGVNGAGVVAQALGAGPSGPCSPGDLGTTTFRAPALPISFAALAGRDLGKLHDPARVTPIHAWHEQAGARFEDVGHWKRPWFYPRPGEDRHEAVLRECRAARTQVAVMDASTLGKIEIVGPDSAQFLNRIYTNAFGKLAVGSARYGLMCTADGMVLDDGVTMRLAPDRFLMSTTTGGAATVMDWLEEWHQTEWTSLNVSFTSVTEQWATIAVVGPLARQVIGRLAPHLDVSNEAFGFMTFRETLLDPVSTVGRSGAASDVGADVADAGGAVGAARDAGDDGSDRVGDGTDVLSVVRGVPARIARISFSGELAFELNVAGWYGLALWQAVMAAGTDLGITPYGTEAMHVLRAEKGFPIVGQETDGTVTPHDLGMSWIVSTKKEFVGRRSLSRPDTLRPDRKHLVGLLPVDPSDLLPEGAPIVHADTDLGPLARSGPVGRAPIPMLGHVTSSYHSAALGRTFALALIKGGRERIGDRVLAPIGDRVIVATVTKPVFYDEEGARRDG